MVIRPRHVLITGGSRGIGLAIAQLFAQNAYRCTLISRSEKGLKAAVSTLKPLPSNETSSHDTQIQTLPSTHFQHSYIPGNITAGSHFWATNTTNNESLGKYLPKVDAKDANHPSRIDVLVNCAGVTQQSLFLSTDDAVMESVVNTNLTAMMQGTRFLMRQGYIRDEKKNDMSGPVIINVASLLGLQGGYGAVVYAASKAGVLGFTRALGTEYAGHRVRVNAIVPGYVETDMTTSLNAGELSKQIPLGRFGKPEEIAQAALFLAENKYAHNCVLNLDGGLSAV